MNPVGRAELRLVLVDRFQKNLKWSENLLTLGWMFLSECGIFIELLKDGSLNSCIIQSVLVPLAARPL